MNKKDILFYGMIVVIVVLAIYMVWFTRTESYKCMLSPLVYGVNNLQSTENDSITCTCSGKLSSASLIVTKDNMSYSNYIITNPLSSLEK